VGKLKITFLGTGTSQGIPLINCDCPVCISDDPKNKRLRTSITIQNGQTTILVDTTPDLRQQLLRNPVKKIDAVLFTHSHADHIFGIDDLRRFNFIYKKRLEVFANEETLNRLNYLFDYAFGDGELLPGLPNLHANRIKGKFKINNLKIEPLDLFHGGQSVLGFRIERFAYCTDVNKIPEKTFPNLKNLDILVLDALRETPHPTHFSLEEAIEQAEKIGAKITYFIHMSHKIDHNKHSANLPENMYFAFDGLQIEV